MGVDVFGRNTFGGGGMQSHVAVDAAFSAGIILEPETHPVDESRGC